MCKDVGAYPKCACPAFTAPGATVGGDMNWDDLLTWGKDTIKKNTQLSAIQHRVKILKAMQVSKGCMHADEKEREAVQNRLHGICTDMCKEIGTFPKKCSCPGFEASSVDSTPGVMTWEELLNFMGDVATSAEEQIKGWKSEAR